MAFVSDEVWERWESQGREFESLNLVLRTGLPAVAAAELVWSACRAQWDEDEDWPAEITVSPTIHGVGISLLNCEEITAVIFRC
jgi:hypothetical protein